MSLYLKKIFQTVFKKNVTLQTYYLTLISNNAIDMAFTFETDWQEKHKNEDYEQIDISSLINKIDSEAV